MTDPLTMDSDGGQKTEKIFNITMEILTLLTGEPCTAVKKASGERVSPKGCPPSSTNHEQKVLSVADKMVDLLAGEESSEEEAECKDEGTRDTPPLLNSKYAPKKRKAPPHPLYSQASPEEYTDIPQPHRVGGMGDPCTSVADLDAEDNDLTEDSQEEPPNPEEWLPNNGDAVTHETPYSGDKVFPCYQCSKCFTRKSSLIRHQRMHTGEKPFPCTECRKRFTRKATLLEHMRVHTGGKPFLCAECGECFAQNSELIAHKKTHLDLSDNALSCEDCGKDFKHKSDLAVHRRVHRAKTTVICSDCGKGFITKSVLLVHQRTHTGERPYSCEECGKSFTQKSDLIVHQRTHTGERPFACTECGKCFTLKSTLVIHQRIHRGEKPFTCGECGRRFTQKSTLVTHQKLHTPLKVLHCLSRSPQ